MRMGSMLAMAALLSPGCSREGKSTTKVVDSDPGLVSARQSWRKQQEQMLRSELSPLSRIDFVHLPVGEHVVAADAAPLKLSAAAMAPYQGKIQLQVEAGKLRLSAAPPVPRNGQLVGQAELENGNVVALGRLRLMVVGLPADPSLAVYDPEAPEQRAFRGLHYFEDDGRYVARAHLERYPQPRPVRVAASRGSDKELTALGTLRFTLADKAASLEAYSEGEGTGRLFLIFKDETSGKPGGSYGAGRYLYAKLLAGDDAVLDFNQAWNPLCAYSSYFHCPIPPRQDWLAQPIPVGERPYHE